MRSLPSGFLAAHGGRRQSSRQNYAAAAHEGGGLGAVAVRAATDLLTSGTYDSVADGIAYGTMNDAITATA